MFITSYLKVPSKDFAAHWLRITVLGKSWHIKLAKRRKKNQKKDRNRAKSHKSAGKGTDKDNGGFREQSSEALFQAGIRAIYICGETNELFH